LCVEERKRYLAEHRAIPEADLATSIRSIATMNSHFCVLWPDSEVTDAKASGRGYCNSTVSDQLMQRGQHLL